MDGNGFEDADANAYWGELPEKLREIAVSEIRAGNVVEQVLRNNNLGIVLLAFERGPLSAERELQGIVRHTRYDTGNYCYDGTKCTFEDIVSGCFLAFDDPDYVREDF